MGLRPFSLVGSWAIQMACFFRTSIILRRALASRGIFRNMGLCCIRRSDLNGTPSVFIGGQLGYPNGLLFSNKHNFAPRIGIARNFPKYGIVLHTSYRSEWDSVRFHWWAAGLSKWLAFFEQA